MPILAWEGPADQMPNFCPEGCGGVTEDPYGGPCGACWRAVDDRERAERECWEGDRQPECPESHMDDGSHATDYEDSGSCPWCGESNPDWRAPVAPEDHGVKV